MRLSVRTQLFVVLTVLTSVPALWLGLNAARTQSDRALASDQSAGVATARTVVRETQRIFTQFTQVTESLAAHAVQLRPWVSATLQGHVDAHLSHHDGFAVMYVADATGRSIVTSPELGSDGQPNAGVDYSSRDYFVGARDTLRTSLSRVQIGKKTGVPNVQIGAPLIGAAGEFLGIAEGSVKLDGLQQLVHGIANNLSMTRIVIVDDQAHVVADSAQTTIDTLGSVADQSVFERPERGVQYRVAVDEKSVLTRATVLRAQVQGKPWTVVVMRPDSVVVAVAEHARSQTVQAVALATVMGLLFAALLSAVLAAPIARLAQVADEVAGGATRSTFPAVAPWHPREMAGLKRALSGMLTALDSQAEELEVAVAERTRELEEANQRLAMLAISVENAAEAIQIIAADGQVQYVNPAFTRMTGYALEELDSVGAQGSSRPGTGPASSSPTRTPSRAPPGPAPGSRRRRAVRATTRS